MEIKTREQYVLAQLFDQQDENDRIMAENDHLRSDVDELAGQVKTIEAFHESPIQQAIVEEGRRALLDRCTGYAPSVKHDGEVVPFDEWCLENVRKYSLPGNITRLAFIKEFEPELREEYDKRVAEACE